MPKYAQVFKPKLQKASEVLALPNVTLSEGERFAVEYRIKEILAMPPTLIRLHCEILAGNARASLVAFHNPKKADRQHLNGPAYWKDITIARALHEDLEARGIAHVWKE